MEADTIITTILSLIGGGTITSLFVIPYTRRKAKADAESSVVDNYERLIESIEKRVAALEEEVQELKKESWELREENKHLHGVITKGYLCPLLRENPNVGCPIQQAYESKMTSKED